MKKLNFKKSHFSQFSFGWVGVYIFMTAVVAFTALPMVYLISTAFKPLNELYIFPPQFFVRNPTLKNFYDLMASIKSSSVPYVRYVFNSLFITVTTVVLTVLVSTLGAYGLVKHSPPGSKLLFQIVIAALMFSPYVTQIPRYLIMNSIGLMDTFLAIILPSVATAYNFFLMKQFVEQIPNDMIEAARIDGSGEYRIYWKIIMPMLSPAWATLLVFSFVNSWNDYFSPLIYISDQAKKTLPLALTTISGGSTSMGRAGAVAMSTLLMTLPNIIIFSLSQKKVMETMAYSGIKG